MDKVWDVSQDERANETRSETIYRDHEERRVSKFTMIFTMTGMSQRAGSCTLSLRRRLRKRRQAGWRGQSQLLPATRHTSARNARYHLVAPRQPRPAAWACSSPISLTKPVPERGAIAARALSCRWRRLSSLSLGSTEVVVPSGASEAGLPCERGILVLQMVPVEVGRGRA